MRKELLFLIILSILFISCYIVKQGFYQLDLVLTAKPIKKVLLDPTVSNKVKEKLLLVIEIRQFAINEIGLTSSANYTRYKELKRKYVAYNINACLKYKFEPYKWTFPIVGTFPYLGYFELKDAIELKKFLEKKGYDVNIRGVTAYSTTGFFDDPFLSTMVDYKASTIAEIIIHELTHSTIWLAGEIEFNENLATFVGNTGAKLFIEKKYGVNSKELKFMQDLDSDSFVFSDFIKNLYNTLDNFYNNSELSIKEKINGREKIFNEYKNIFKNYYSKKLKTDYYKGIEHTKFNNAFIMIFKTYYHDLSLFQKAYNKLGKDLRRTIEYFKKYKKLKNKKPLEELKDFVKDSQS